MRRLFLGLLLCSTPLTAYSGPPYLTDDPDPVDYQTFEIIPAYSLDRAHDGSEIDGPIADFNYGIWPDMHLNIQGGLPCMRCRLEGLPSSVSGICGWP